MKISFKQIQYICISLITVMMLLFSLSGFHFIDNKISDLIFKLKSPGSVPNNILLIWIDDESLINLNTTFPFNRKYFADALERLNQHSPKTIGFDFLFSEAGVIKESDDIFQKAISSSKTPIVLGSEINTHVPVNRPIFSSESGLTNIIRDSDSFVRSFIPAFILPGSPIEYAFSIKILQKSGYKIDVDEKHLFYKEKIYQLEEYSQYPINYFRKDYPHLSFHKLLSNDFNPSVIKDKIVIIAASFESSKEFEHTPISAVRLKGGEIHANILEMFMKNDFIKKASPLTNLLILLLIAALFIIQPKNSCEHFIIIPLLMLAAPLVFIFSNLQLPLFYPLLLSLILLILNYFFYQKELLMMKEDIIRELKNLPKNPKNNKKIEDYGLTKRELEISQMLLKNKYITNEEIGKKLFISTGTVKKHLASIYEKIESVNKGKIANRHTIADFIPKEAIKDNKN